MNMGFSIEKSLCLIRNQDAFRILEDGLIRDRQRYTRGWSSGVRSPQEWLLSLAGLSNPIHLE